MANEKRLIDANTLIHRVCAERDSMEINHACDIGYHNGLNMAVSMAINAPTVEAVEVRCAECKHYQQYHKGRTEELCEWGKCKLISMDIDMPCNGFCCFGERRNNEPEEPV